MAAALGEHLVFQVDGSDTGGLELLHGPFDIECFAEAGVRVGNDRQPRRRRQRPGKVDELGEGHQADVGQTQ